MSAAKREAFEQVRSRYMAAVGQGVERSLERFVMDSEAMPDEMVRLFFQEPGGRRVGFRPETLDEMQRYIDTVLARRRSDLSTLKTLERVAACLNDLEAVLHWQRLSEGVRAIIATFKQIADEVSKIRTGGDRGPFFVG